MTTDAPKPAEKPRCAFINCISPEAPKGWGPHHIGPGWPTPLKSSHHPFDFSPAPAAKTQWHDCHDGSGCNCGADIPAPAQPTTREAHPDFKEASIKYRGRVLEGRVAHWCDDWDDLPIDETCEEWPCGCVIGRAFTMGLAAATGARTAEEKPSTAAEAATGVSVGRRIVEAALFASEGRSDGVYWTGTENLIEAIDAEIKKAAQAGERVTLHWLKGRGKWIECSGEATDRCSMLKHATATLDAPEGRGKE